MKYSQEEIQKYLEILESNIKNESEPELPSINSIIDSRHFPHQQGGFGGARPPPPQGGFGGRHSPHHLLRKPPFYYLEWLSSL